MQISLVGLVNNIIGPFAPTGCHASDAGRAERIEHVETLVCRLLAELSACAGYKDDERDSVGRIGRRAHQALCAAASLCPTPSSEQQPGNGQEGSDETV